MLSECGEREDGFNTNRHSQRGRWERGKIQSETKKDQRKLIRLDIEEVMDEMYLLYKWMTKEYGFCVEGNKINKEIEEENVR